ncbi:hypothetical protein A5768_25705 [Mycolicibacterium fortuitum]|uniref:hypothetical protein n=1 Tax=Mycolicibacterium fortuitum TaxID=1766 RepID=UPI0007EA1B81|nr:hypothetical protein [Mycolicibacterium fortuitum]OBG21506.1 hypothetical protein A5768_25705 [Mycolicibacterium fortuitum]
MPTFHPGDHLRTPVDIAADAAQAAESRSHPDAGLPLPVHHLDEGHLAADKQRGVCPHSGTGDMADGCPRGCEGAREHYSNDGHPQCEDDPFDETTADDVENLPYECPDCGNRHDGMTSGTERCPDCECEDDNECEGHESLAGEHMGESVYCDGSCRRAAKRARNIRRA